MKWIEISAIKTLSKKLDSLGEKHDLFFSLTFLGTLKSGPLVMLNADDKDSKQTSCAISIDRTLEEQAMDLSKRLRKINNK